MRGRGDVTNDCWSEASNRLSKEQRDNFAKSTGLSRPEKQDPTRNIRSDASGDGVAGDERNEFGVELKARISYRGPAMLGAFRLSTNVR